MTRILLDSNIVLDVLLSRTPHDRSSAAVWAAVERGAAEGLLSAHAFTTIYYLARKMHGTAHARSTMDRLLKVFSVAAVNDSVLRDATLSGITDFEDAVTAFAARNASCSFIVTRDVRGFRGSPVPSMTPESAVLNFASP